MQFPKMSGPLVKSKPPLQNELDLALATIATGLGGFIGVAVRERKSSYEGVILCLWGLATLLSVYVFQKTRKEIRR